MISPAILNAPMHLLLHQIHRAIASAFGRSVPPLLVGLVLLGVAPSSSVWLAVLFFLIGLTSGELLKCLPYYESPDDPDSDEVPVLIRPEPALRRDAIAKIIAWWAALPALLFAAWAWFEPIIDWHHPLRIPAAAVVAAGLAVLAWPDLRHFRGAGMRTIIRSVSAGLIVVAALASVAIRHPYVIPGNPDANRLRVERLLSSTSIVTLQRHAETLVAHAAELERAGDIRSAGALLSLATRADGTDPAIQTAFADFLERHGRPGEDQPFRKLAAELQAGAHSEASNDEYQFDSAGPLPLFPTRSGNRHCILLAGDHDTPAGLLDLLGFVLHTELGVEVYRLPDPISIDGSTKSRGLLTNQINVFDAWNEVHPQVTGDLKPPCQMLVVTARDLFAPGTNYIYGWPTVNGCGIISYARLGDVDDPAGDRKLLDNLCKQALSTVLKSMLIYPSPDPRDVTAYVNGPLQLQRKGRRPTPPTLAIYRDRIAKWENLTR